ncbi:uncharacterized protein MELLADRAFT_102329 [Melampsora larici-populina 98AG31]|uniref:Uncharacterized protein n=1 Tax=Melampsora larici-populina (strain 98AG31 / pathotype 3-4-7) TaxID=747676 RepID=F4R7Y0_MELLP|nr:uncharacterized protein MELLADRAFT_102329 [Melampsora larici-populina 98AG31]EGG11711.1 hypothetical protein MELLADRAFT_102329 [Melampsora larici-populina 98AG31]
MAALPETRTVTTSGVLNKPTRFLRTENPADEVFTRLNYQHCLHDPRRSPADHVYSTRCPHEFRFQKRTTRTEAIPSATGPLPPVEDEKVVVEELVVHLSDLVYQMYAEWTMSWEFTVLGMYDDQIHIINHATITPYSDPAEWKTITVGSVKDILGRFKGSHGLEDVLYFKIKWSRQEISLATFDKTRRELDDLKKAMLQTRNTLLETFQEPSIDMTRLVFRSKHGETFKHLYVPSRILTRFEYFQKCHSPEDSESQRLDKAKRKRDEAEMLTEELPCNDSDEEWDSEPDNSEPDKLLSMSMAPRTQFPPYMNVLILYDTHCDIVVDEHIKHSSIMQSAALHFAPLRSAYQQYCENPSVPAPESGQLPKLENVQSQQLKPHLSQEPKNEQSQQLKPHLSQEPKNEQSQQLEPSQAPQLIPWPEWAEAHCTPHTVVPGFKVLSSPKSLHRLAHTLNIPELKAICHKQIINSLEVGNVISEIQSPVFKQHEELRVEAYKWINKNWQSLTTSDLISLVKNLSEEEATLLVEYTLDDLAPCA